MLLISFLLFAIKFQRILAIETDVDDCVLTAICNCEAKNKTGTSVGVNDSDTVNICSDANKFSNSLVQSTLLSKEPTQTVIGDNDKSPLKYLVTCRYVDLTNSSTNPSNINPTEVVLLLKYPSPCNNSTPTPTPVPTTTPTPVTTTTPAPTPNNKHSTGTILVIIFFTCVFGYLGMGIAVNYFLIGARGLELLPHISFWRDFPSLVRDGARFLQNGCKARPSELNTGSPESYDAI